MAMFESDLHTAREATIEELNVKKQSYDNQNKEMDILKLENQSL